jgi:hypothetical protein
MKKTTIDGWNIVVNWNNNEQETFSSNSFPKKIVDLLDEYFYDYENEVMLESIDPEPDYDAKSAEEMAEENYQVYINLK